MKEVAQAVLEYLRENILFTLLIAIIAGFAGVKTVAVGKKGNPALYFIVGLVGAFLGQFAILYLGLKEILDEFSVFRPFFDLIAAYIGSFIVATIVNFFRAN